jgi:hypothetical protein
MNFNTRSHFKRQIASLGLVFLASVFLISCSRMTEENLSKIQSGMSRDEVKRIMGTPRVFEVGTDEMATSGAADGPERERDRGHVYDGTVQPPPPKTIFYYVSSSSVMEIDFAYDGVIDKKETRK